jgi:alpha-tubulin suppressor-like RCC1 family protein
LIYCVGQNDYGQLGIGSKSSTSEPTLVSGLPQALAVSLGKTSACAISSTFKVWCWGDNASGQLGTSQQIATSLVAIDTGLSEASNISVGDNFACAIRSTQVWCWGDNTYSQLGHTGNTPAQVLLPAGALQVSSGSNFACAILVNSSVYCWGANESGQLGRGSNSAIGSASAALLQNAQSISAGKNSVCAVLTDASVSCWGSNSNGQLGNGTVADSSTPAPVTSISGAAQVSVGSMFACTRLVNASVNCWGKNDHGQLGIVSTNDSSIRVPSKIKSSAFLAAGTTHLCSLNSSGDIDCVGSNDLGQWGSISSSTVPLKANVSDALSISAGSDETCAIYGPNRSLGCFGSFTANLDQVSGVLQVDVGDESACYVRINHSVWCFGSNNGGELGDGTTTDRTDPVQVAGLANITQVAVGFRHACAVSADGLAYCWGSNTKGQLGTADTKDYRTPQAVVGLVNVAGISAGHWHTCAWLSDGSDYCFGDNSKSQVGSNALKAITAMSLSDYGTCALKSDKTVICWGLNSDQQSPANPGVANALSIYSAATQNCALLQGGTITCWGKPSLNVGSLSSLNQLALGNGFICGLSNSSVSCLGSNSAGQLGSSFGFKPVAANTTPTLVGDLKVGTTLAVSNVDSIPGSTMSYEWFRSAQIVAGVTGSQYPLTTADFNRTMAVRAHRNLWGLINIDYPSTASVKILTGDLPSDLQIQTTGTAVVDGTLLLAMPSLPDGASVIYRWTQLGKTGTRTAATNTFKPSDLGGVFTITATVSSAGYNSRDFSLQLPPVSAATQVNTTAVTISGKYKVGSTLIARSLGWATGSKLSFQWLRNKAVIKGAIKQSYKLVAADTNTKLSCRVSVTKLGYDLATATSAQTVKIVK